MSDEYVSVGKLVARVLWGLTAVLLASVWATGLTGRGDLASLLGFTTGVLAMIAMTATVRTYMVRVSGLIRAKRWADEEVRPTSMHGLR